MTYGLGSCIGVCLVDMTAGVGALCHYMLPDSKTDPNRARSVPRMFGDLLIAELLRAFERAGGRLRHSRTFIAGGASMSLGPNLFDIGVRNAAIARSTLERFGLGVDHAEIGGRISRTLRLEVATGLVTVATPGLPARSYS